MSWCVQIGNVLHAIYLIIYYIIIEITCIFQFMLIIHDYNTQCENAELSMLYSIK